MSRKQVIRLAVLGLFISLAALILVASTSARYACKAATSMLIYGIPGTGDERNAEIIRHTIITAHDFREPSVSQPSVPPVFYTPGSHLFLSSPAVFDIYGLKTEAEQLQVVRAVAKVVGTQIRRPVRLEFYEKEQWIEIPSTHSGHRAPEHVLRVFAINRYGQAKVAGKDFVHNYHTTDGS